MWELLLFTVHSDLIISRGAHTAVLYISWDRLQQIPMSLVRAALDNDTSLPVINYICQE